MRRRMLGLGLLLLLVGAACSGPAHHDPAAGPNPDVVPSVITPAYVDAVFRVLNHVNGNAARELIKSHALTGVVRSDLRSIYAPELYTIEIEVFNTGLAQDVHNLRSPIGDRRTKVSHLIDASDSCIFVETTSDLSAVELHPTANAASEFWELVAKMPSQDPNKLNPTPWVLAFNQDYQTPTSLPSPC